MAYARLHALRDSADLDSPAALESRCADFNRALDDLYSVGFDLSAFKLDDETRTEDVHAAILAPSSLRARLDALLGYMDLLAGLP